MTLRFPIAALVGMLVSFGLPVAARGDATATDGTNVLTVTASITPANARRAHHPQRRALHIRVQIARVDGARPLGFTGIVFDLPPGARFDPRAVAQCRERVLVRGDAVDPARCPRRSRIGSGVAYADARPILTDPVAADVELINGLAEWGNDDEPYAPPRPAIFLVAQALDVQILFAALFEHGGRDVRVPLGGTVASPDPFTITALDLRIRDAGNGNRPYLRAPATCHRAWTFSVTYLFASPLTARDGIPCRTRARTY